MHLSLRAIQIASMLYIEVPISIFLLGWVNPLISIPTTLLLLIQFLFFVRDTRTLHKKVFLTSRQLFLIVLVAVIWVMLSAAGHRGITAGDYFKHNALLNDLIQNPWPVQYIVAESLQKVMLVYYSAYYLPAAVVGKLLGWGWANIVIGMWTFTGVMIVASWFIFYFPKKSFHSFLLFIFMSGLDGFGRMILFHKTGMNPDWEWWAGEWQYSGVTTLLFHVPQHALGAWIFISFLISSKREILTLYSSLILWSPFVWIGSLPFVLYQWFQKRIRITLFDSLVGIFIALICGSYLASSMYAGGNSETSGQWLWQRLPLLQSLSLVRLFFFYFFEFVLCFVIISKVKQFFQKNVGFLTVALTLLLFIPWYRLGLLNDFAMRSSIPALFVLTLYAVYAFLKSKKYTRYIVYAFIIIMSIYPLILMHNGAVHLTDSSPQLTLSNLDTPQVRMQYLGKSQSVFTSVFSKDQQKTAGIIYLK